MASFSAHLAGSAPAAARCGNEMHAAPRAQVVSLTSRGVPCSAKPRYLGSCSALAPARPQSRKVALRATAQNTSTEAAGPVTESDWEEKVLKSPVPVIVDFWAPWCGPCRMIAPMVDEIAVEYGEKIRADAAAEWIVLADQFKLNTDESPSIATDYGIRSIPTVMVFKGGKKMDVVIGAVPKSTLVQSFDKFVD